MSLSFLLANVTVIHSIKTQYINKYIILTNMEGFLEKICQRQETINDEKMLKIKNEPLQSL